MIALLPISVMGALSEGAAPGRDVIAQIDFGDWGEFLVFAAVIAFSAVNGLIRAAKKKREAREREQQMPLPKSSRTPPAAKPARARPPTDQRQTARPRQPILLRPKPPAQPRPVAKRPSPVSASPPTADVRPVFETLAEAIREANKDKPQQSDRSRRRVTAREPARPVAATRRPSKKSHQDVSDRHFIAEHEREHEESMEKRLGHVAGGVVAPVHDPYAKKSVGAHALRGVDLRQAIIVKEILGPPVAMRDQDDYFSP